MKINILTWMHNNIPTCQRIPSCGWFIVIVNYYSGTCSHCLCFEVLCVKSWSELTYCISVGTLYAKTYHQTRCFDWLTFWWCNCWLINIIFCIAMLYPFSFASIKVCIFSCYKIYILLISHLYDWCCLFRMWSDWEGHLIYEVSDDVWNKKQDHQRI